MSSNIHKEFSSGAGKDLTGKYYACKNTKRHVPARGNGAEFTLNYG